MNDDTDDTDIDTLREAARAAARKPFDQHTRADRDALLRYARSDEMRRKLNLARDRLSRQIEHREPLDPLTAELYLLGVRPQTLPTCARCGHDADLHALDGRGVSPGPYCEHEDGCACPSYLSQNQGGGNV